MRLPSFPQSLKTEVRVISRFGPLAVQVVKSLTAFQYYGKRDLKKIWPQIHFSILATDIDEKLLKRAKEGRYKKSSLKEVPEDILKGYFKMDKGFYILDRPFGRALNLKGTTLFMKNHFLGWIWSSVEI